MFIVESLPVFIINPILHKYLERVFIGAFQGFVQHPKSDL